MTRKYNHLFYPRGRVTAPFLLWASIVMAGCGAHACFAEGDGHAVGSGRISRSRVTVPPPALEASPEATPPQTVFRDGAPCLFMGHSFFVPVAASFDRIGTQNGFPLHRVDTVFASGRGGSPGALWNDPRRRRQIEDILATGEIELLGMTAFGVPDDSFQAYQQWIELALGYNAKTRFFIGQSWVPGGPLGWTPWYDLFIEISGIRLLDVVEALRTSYPDTAIYYLNYGKTASIMKALFEAGELEDLHQLVGRNRKSLFLDGFAGHGGPMMTELSALCWMQTLYGADIRGVDHAPYDRQDVNDITTWVLQYNGELDRP